MAQYLSKAPRTALLSALLAVALIATACGDDDADEQDVGEPIDRAPGTSIIIPEGEPIIIGISTALTGGPVGERGAEYRDAAVASIERWKEASGEQIAGHDIEVHAEDDGCSDADTAVRAAGHLLGGEDGHRQLPGLVGVIGPQCSGGVAAVMAEYAEAGIVMISGSATTTSLTTEQPEGGFFFRTAYRNDLEGLLIGIFLGSNPELGIDSAYLIDNGGVYGRDLADSSAQVALENGLTVQRASIVEGTVDFTDLVATIMEEEPGFVGYTGFNPEAALIYAQLRDAGYEGVFGAGDGAASEVGFVGPVGAETAEGVIFAACTYPLRQDFLDDFVDLHGYEPVAAFPAQYADAATVLLDAVAAVAQVGDDGSLIIQPTTLRDAVRATTLEGGLSGDLAFDMHGDRIPLDVEDVEEFVEQAYQEQDPTAFTDLGLVPCQVQDGKLVNLFGPGAGETRFE